MLHAAEGGRDKILRSADFQSAGRGIFNARRVGQRSADWNSAIQQEAILRHDRRIFCPAPGGVNKAKKSLNGRGLDD